MSSSIRRAVRALSDDQIRTVWDESAAWDRDGFLPDDTTLRSIQRAVMPDEFSVAIWLDFIARETWREAARRRCLTDTQIDADPSP